MKLSLSMLANINLAWQVTFKSHLPRLASKKISQLFSPVRSENYFFFSKSKDFQVTRYFHVSEFIYSFHFFVLFDNLNTLINITTKYDIHKPSFCIYLFTRSAKSFGNED